MAVYKKQAIIPDMLVKLKQGAGRLIRTVNDTGVVAILDSRVRENGQYRKTVLSELPFTRVTSDLRIIHKFFRLKKSADYFRRYTR
jgi:ATP-dependent DNA helicase DinG